MGSRQAILTATILFLCCLCAQGQDVQSQGKDQPPSPVEPTVKFERYWEDATPQDYVITVKSTGEANYISRNPTRPESNGGDPDYTLDFTMSSATSDRIFTVAKETNYFHGDFDYKRKVANTGKKTLSYADPVRQFQTTYNYSENRNIEETTKVFEGISATIEHGRKLQFMRRFDKLSLDAELKAMEDMAQNGYLAEIQIIAPLLQNLVNDTSVLHIARQRAQHLLESSHTTP